MSIKVYVQEKYGLKMSSLYISQVKRKCDIVERENYNKLKSKDAKTAVSAGKRESDYEGTQAFSDDLISKAQRR